MKELIKKSFDLWVKMRWLKMIEKETKKRDKLWSRYNRQEYVVSELLKEYFELYPEALAEREGRR